MGFDQLLQSAAGLLSNPWIKFAFQGSGPVQKAGQALASALKGTTQNRSASTTASLPFQTALDRSLIQTASNTASHPAQSSTTSPLGRTLTSAKSNVSAHWADQGWQDLQTFDQNRDNQISPEELSSGLTQLNQNLAQASTSNPIGETPSIEAINAAYHWGKSIQHYQHAIAHLDGDATSISQSDWISWSRRQSQK